jgi:hypothetical protein
MRAAQQAKSMSPIEGVAAQLPKRRLRIGLALRVTALSLWIGLLCWVGVRWFWWWRLGVGVTENPGVEAVWRLHYQELYSSGAVNARLAPDDGYYDVLLLGGSVLEQTVPALEQSLRSELEGRVRLYNLARAAHTSRDSYFKLQRLTGKSFDLVIFYDGINDARMNCCPDDVYRDDYRHFSWYDSLETRLTAGTVSVSDLLRSSLNRGMLSFEIAEGREFSNHVKTAKAYRQNLESIADAVDQFDGRLLLMTFAYYLPQNYTTDTFRAHQLGYGRGKYDVGIDVWGTPKGVEAAILAHNEVMRELGKKHKHAIVVDEEKQMPKSGTCFSDPCHLTDQGIATFAEHVLGAVHGDIEHWKAAQHQLATTDQ